MLASKLYKGDTIGIFSSSYPASSDFNDGFKYAINFIEEKGFHIKYGSLTGKRDYYRSGTIRERADELNELIHSDVKCIMAVSGGYVSNSILPYIDYDELIRNPKIVIGYSDVTAILLGIYAKTGLTTYYGPTVSDFSNKPPMNQGSYNYMSDILIADTKPPFTLPVPSYWTEDYIDCFEEIEYTTYPNKMITLNNGVVDGRLIVCNLNTLLGFMASEYMPVIKHGDILLIENKNLDAETLEREFSMLKVCGVFDKIGGLIIGKHIDYKDRGTGRKHYEVLQEVMGDVSFPILSEFDCSHAMPMLTLPIGCRVRLDADNKRLTLIEPWIKMET